MLHLVLWNNYLSVSDENRIFSGIAETYTSRRRQNGGVLQVEQAGEYPQLAIGIQMEGIDERIGRNRWSR